MKLAIFILLLIQQSSQISLELKGACTCDKYTFQQDCSNNQICQWIESSTNQVCIEKQVIQKTFCNSIAPENCKLTLGCAYQSNNCVPFSGCSAYFKQTNEDCQLISRQCLSDQIKCIDVKPCTSYDEKNCSFHSSSGTTLCVWENDACRDQICTEAPKEYSDDVQCNTWLKGCITNGKGCILPPLLACEKYTQPSASSNLDTYCDGYLGVGGTCTLDSQTKVCRLKVCEDYRGSSDEECNGFMKGCVTIGTKCASRKQLCSEFIGDDSSCKEKVGSDGKCFKSDFLEGPCELRRCDTASASEVKSDMDCNNYQLGCKYTGLGCVSKLQECSSYTGTKSSCAKQKGSDGFCERDNETTGQCQAKLCSNAPNSYNSNSQCQEYQIGCVSNGNGCVSQSTCVNTINIIGCSGIKSCEWNENCLKQVTCNDLTEINCLSDLTFFGVPKLQCKWHNNICSQLTCKDANLQEYTDIKCTEFLEGCISNGIQCLEEYLPCSYYSGTQSQCAQFRQDKCWNDDNASSQSICRSRLCIDDLESKTDMDCQKFLSGCRTNKKGCVPSTSPCNVYSGTAEICQEFKNGLCWNTSDANEDTPCTEKKCTDDITSTTDRECQAFLPECVTNLNGCISKEAGCSLYRGNQNTCSQFKGKNGTVKCWQITDVLESTSCIDKKCSQDTISTNNQQCQNFLEGCLFNGTLGCISSIEPCTSYKGDLNACQNYTGNGFKCWNDSTATSTTPCTQRTCADDMTSTTNLLCEASQHGCVTKGKGCIEAEQQCGAYEGTQAQCGKFKGENGTVPCWNSSTMVSTPCKVKKCTDSQATNSNDDCEQFLTGCITNGLGCISPPQPCSYFSKLHNDCSLYIASDGPCKNSEISDQCTPRICSEASNTVYTQEFCKAYHPSCISITTGCAKQAPDCNNIKNNLACALNTGCSWINNCSQVITDCSNQTKCNSKTFGSSTTTTICETSTNSLKQYVWDSGTCKIQSCETLPASYSTHQQCQVVNNCTTNGQGCVVMGPCSSYKSSRICGAAKSTDKDKEGKCNWNKDTNSCNTRICQDSGQGYETDTKCQFFLLGCKSNGVSCISPGFNCSQLITADACIKDSYNNPCLFVKGFCYNYTKCTDILKTTHYECQTFSDQCTTNGTQCIPKARCEDYITQLSCVVGIDNECGWNPKQGIKNAYCSQFNECPIITKEDDQSVCAQYNQRCISDGSNCIYKTKCSEYLTETACSQNGIDGECYFDKGFCRLKVCEDSINFGIKSYDECKIFLKGVECTTNTINCVQLKQCTSYETIEECHVGTDGKCGFFLPIGLTEVQGIEEKTICRVQVCEDTKSSENVRCQEAYPVGKCITDGVQCILQRQCSEYTSEAACRKGGSDGACTFNFSKCSRMSKCEDAKNDEVGCNREYCQFNSNVNGSFTQTSCTPHTCSTKSLFTNSCTAVTSFDQVYIVPCIAQANSPCTEAIPKELEENSCNKITKNLYYWESGAEENKCKICAPEPIITSPPPVPTTWGIIVTIRLILIVMNG